MQTNGGFEAFTYADVTKCLPEETIVAPQKNGLQFYDPQSGHPICCWGWKKIRDVCVEPGNGDPEEMEMLSIKHEAGLVRLELNHAAPLVESILQTLRAMKNTNHFKNTSLSISHFLHLHKTD